MNLFALHHAYRNWLHTRWPAGLVEKGPEVQEDGRTNVSGVTVVGDLTGIPLLKFSAHTGARAVRNFLAEDEFKQRKPADGVVDVAIIGAGVSGMAAAKEASKNGLTYVVLEASEAFSTIVNFPKGKPIFTYPTDMVPEGDVQFTGRSDIKEGLLDELAEQTAGIDVNKARVESISRDGKQLVLNLPKGDAIRAHRVVVAIGRSGNYRTLGVPGEKLPKVYNRLHDPKEFDGKKVLVVGGGDSAAEAAIALAECGAEVTFSYRKSELNRPKPENSARVMELGQQGAIQLRLGSNLKEIRDTEVELDVGGQAETISNDAVLTLIGREAPLDFFRRSGINITGEWRTSTWVWFIAFFGFCVWMYHWKDGKVGGLYPENWFGDPDPKSLIGTIKAAFSQRWVYYSFAYSLLVVIFGVRRIKRRKTPYVTRQTLTLMAFQVVPLFLIPVIILPWMHANGAFDAGFGQWFMGEFFPGGSGDFWRAFGFVLAWPLFFWNAFNSEPLWGWLIISFIQTFVIIPLIVWKWGKGAYCGWICSCGALAETLGDTHRHKMPHGPGPNKWNMVGQWVLLFAFVIMFLRILGWMGVPGLGTASDYLAKELPLLNFKYIVDLWLAGIIGVGLYFHFSGRVWCRFACPLAALMHIYARFSRFRIFADKKKCISCNVCTSVCHQGIDIMNFANKGLPMEDPECVRCSACVQSCPTGVLSFGEIDRRSGDILRLDRLPASPVQMKEAAAKPVG